MWQQVARLLKLCMNAPPPHRDPKAEVVFGISLHTFQTEKLSGCMSVNDVYDDPVQPIALSIYMITATVFNIDSGSIRIIF